MIYDFVVLGATGMQGKIVSRDLLENGYSVLLCGRDKSRVENTLKRHKRTAFNYGDLRDTDNSIKVIKKSGANVVINCAEGDWNLNALKACLKAEVHSLDLGSEIPMTKEQFALDKNLKKRNLTHITGCGSVPGIGNVMLNYAVDKLDVVSDIHVGFDWNSNIKKFVVPFSIQSIIEEFTDPAATLKRGKFISVKPLSTLKHYHDKYTGDQDCFSVRHPETYTFYYYFKKKGLKNLRFYAGFPEHSFNSIINFIDLGFGNKEEINVNGFEVKPVEVLTEVLKKLEIPEGYEEKETLWLKLEGKKKGIKKTIKMVCHVHTLPGWEDAGCNIDTGMPASIMAQMVKKEIIKERGVFAPEAIVPPEPFFEELRKRKMVVYENGKAIN